MRLASYRVGDGESYGAVVDGGIVDLRTRLPQHATLRDLIASGDLPAVRPPRLRRVWIDRADLDRAIADWKERGEG